MVQKILTKERFFSNMDLFTLFLPLIIEQGLEYCVGLADSMMVAQVGEAAVSGVSLVDFIMALLISIFAALAAGGSVIAGQYLGRNEKDNAEKAAKYYTKKVSAIVYIGFVISAGVIIGLMPFIMNIYGLSQEATDMTYKIVVSHGILMIFIWPMAYVMPVVFRASGDAKFPMIVSIVAMICFRIVLAYVFSVKFNMGMLGTWVAMYCDWITKAVLFFFRYKSGKWTQFKAI